MWDGPAGTHTKQTIFVRHHYVAWPRIFLHIVSNFPQATSHKLEKIMDSFLQKMTVPFQFNINPLMMQSNAYIQSTVFGTAKTKLYLRVNKFASTYFTLHLQESPNPKITLSSKLKYKASPISTWLSYEEKGGPYWS